MPGQRVYYVPPRLVGSVANWSGKDSADGKSWLVEEAKKLDCNTIWFSPFFETSHRLTVDADGKPAAHSLYATRHYGVLDPEFSATKMTGTRDDYSARDLAVIDKTDREHLDYFMAQAKKAGMTVMAMADLVFNHVAADHPLVLQEEADIKGILARDAEGGANEVQPIITKFKDWDGVERDCVIGMRYVDHSGVGASVEKEYYFKFCHNEKFETLNIGMTTGFDTAQVNYASPEAKEFFITGRNGQTGYWKQVIDWCIDRGLSDFRCDIAYRLPPSWWQELITHARQRNPDATFMAETLGGTDAAGAVQKMSEIQVTDRQGNQRPGFDLGMVSNYWWNFTDDWLPQQELPRLKAMAKYGGATSPDNHDTPETLAGHFQKALRDDPRHDELVADICVRNYAISALIANSVYMQMGYEYCNEKQSGVFSGVASPDDWKRLKARAGTALDISADIASINRLKESLGVENCRVEITEHREMQDGKLIKLACEYIDADTGKKTADVVLVVNKQPEKGAVVVTDQNLLALESGGLQRERNGDAPSTVVRDVLIYHTPVAAPEPAAKAAVTPQRRALQPA